MSTQNELSKIKEKISEIEEQSSDGTYIYRGEPEHHEKQPYDGKVSSGLWRQFKKKTKDEEFDIDFVNIEFVQMQILDVVENYVHGLSAGFEMMAQLQHYGGNTNFIDFTTDYLKALFFACDGSHDKDGRIILLQNTDEINRKYRIKEPQNPINRVIAQKSIFMRPPKGFIEQEEYKVINIPKYLKEPMLNHLRKYHGISTETIYNDLHGFITNQDIHESAYIEFYKGLACKKRADETEAEDRQKWYTKSIRYYTEALKFNPQMGEAYHNLGVAYYYTRNPKGAIENLNKAIELNPNDAEAYNYRGLAYREENQFDEAITNYNKAIELRPNHGETYKDRGIAYCYKGDNETETHRKQDFYNNAIKDFTEAIRLKPASTDSYYHRGLTYVKKDDYNRAIEDFTKAIQLNPNFANAYYNRGVVYSSKGDNERAIEDFTKVTQLKPNDADAYFDLGIVHSAEEEFDLVIKAFTKVIELRPDFAIAYNNRGDAYYNKGDYENAIKDLDTAIQLNPDSASIYKDRGDAYQKKGDYENAVKDYSKAIKLNSDYGVPYINRAVAWLHQKKWEKARADLMVAKGMKMKIIVLFQFFYASVANFEEKNGFKLPPDIAEMLTPQ